MMVKLIAARTVTEAATVGMTTEAILRKTLLEGAFMIAEKIQTIGEKTTKEETMAIEIGWTTEEVWSLIACNLVFYWLFSTHGLYVYV